MIYLSTNGLPADVAIAFADRLSTDWLTESMSWEDIVGRLTKPFQHETATLQLARIGKDLEKSTEFLKRETPVFFGGELRSEKRNDENVLRRSLLIGDLDCGQRLDDIKVRLRGFECVVYTTARHRLASTRIKAKPLRQFLGNDEAATADDVRRFLMEKKGYPTDALTDLTVEQGEGVVVARHAPLDRYRVVFPLAAAFDVADDAAKEVWKAANKHFFASLGLSIDPTCCELGRGFYFAARTLDGGLPYVEHMKGQPIDLQAVIAACPRPEPRSVTKTKNERRTQLPANHKTTVAAISPEERETWLCVGMAIHHATGGSEEGFSAWHEWAAKSPKNSPEDDRKTWDGFRTDHENPITWESVEALAHHTIDWPEVAGRKVVGDSRPNVEAALRHLGHALHYDDFARKHVADGEGHLTDTIVRRMWFDVQKLGLRPRKDYFHDAVLSLAEDSHQHPVRDYFARMQETWDGETRLDNMLVRYCGAEDTPLNRAFGARWMVAAVRRARRPGTKFDAMLVLEGAQGVGKSTFGRVLAGDAWFSDSLQIGATPKEIIEDTGGRLIIELAELAGMGKRDNETIKSMISRQEDVATLKYQKFATAVPRQFVLLGTTNSSEYLQDSTGGRRYWCVRVAHVDIESLRRDRDQLWAEAAVREAKGEAIWLDPKLEANARAIQEERRQVHPLEQLLTERVGDREGIIPLNDLFAAIGLGGQNIAKLTGAHGPLVKNAMERLGWKQTRRKLVGGEKRTVYVKGDDADDAVWQWQPADHLHEMNETAGHFVMGGLAADASPARARSQSLMSARRAPCIQ